MAGNRKRSSLFGGLLGLFFLAILLLAPACSQGRNPTPAPLFELTDQFGRPAGLAQLRGRAVVLTFLYTNCPDTCPLYIAGIQRAVTRLGTTGSAGVVMVAVTVDPDRDTVSRLREFASHLAPGWLFLTGEPGQLKTTWENYRIYVEKPREDTDPGEGTAGHGDSPEEHQGYEVIHNAKVVLIDKEGFLRAELTGDWGAEELEAKLRRLLAGQEITGDFRPWQSFVGFLYACGPVSFNSLATAVGHFLLLLSVPTSLVAVGYLLTKRR